MANASLQLLKGKKPVETELEKTPPAEQAAEPKKSNVSVMKKPAAAAEPAKEAPPQEAAPAEAPAEEAVTVDVDKLTGPEIDALVKEHDIAVPETWDKQINGQKKMTVPEKKTWLKEQFEEAPAEGAEAAAAPEAEVKAGETVSEGTGTAVATTDKKAVTAKDSKKAAKTLGGEVVSPDALTDMVHDIENLKEKDAKALVKELAETAEFTYFKLGGVLSVIQANGWFEPYASFREYVEKEHGINYRRATYWVGIYNDLSEAKIPWEKVKHLGWTKLKEIAGILTPENVDEWVKIAEQQTTLQLIETVANSKKADAPKALEDQTSKTVTTKTFKVHEDQKKTIDAAIGKAKEQSGTTFDTAALEFICLDFMGSKKAATLRDQLKAAGIEPALEALGEAFPDANFSVELPEAAE